jgi:hypothetical protein
MRRFTPARVVLSVALTWMVAAALMAQDRKLGTIGPPPRQDPQRMTSAESLPPLPLPATPMRRSEPKAEPAPPTFVAKLAYGDSQDYMPNPGDLDNLLRHVRRNLDAWYGWKIQSLDDIATQQAAGEKCQIPLLYLTGYQAFTLSEKQRLALREYLLDGGTLLADATLGSPAFSESFLQEMATIFPQHEMQVLPLDHPVYRAFFQYANVEYYTIEKGVNTKMQSPPQLMGLNLAARTAVIFSPYDMSCGWDGFVAPPSSSRVPGAPRSKALNPPDAVRLGINIIAYASALRPFASAQSSTLQVVGTQEQARAAVVIGQLRHQGDWNPDPSSLQQLVRLLAQQTSVPVAYEVRPVDPQLDQLADTPVLVMTGMSDPRLDDQQVAVLRRHLQAGGFLYINNTSGYSRFDREARNLIARILPDQALEPLTPEHALFAALHQVEQVRHAAGEAQPPRVEAVMLGSRAAIVYTPSDCLGLLKGIHDPFANAYDAASSRKLSLNILCYAMQR